MDEEERYEKNDKKEGWEVRRRKPAERLKKSRPTALYAGTPWRKPAIKMLKYTFVWLRKGCFCCSGEESGLPPGTHIREPLLIGRTAALVGLKPLGPHWRSPSLCRRRYHFWMLIKTLARLKKSWRLNHKGRRVKTVHTTPPPTCLTHTVTRLYNSQERTQWTQWRILIFSC